MNVLTDDALREVLFRGDYLDAIRTCNTEKRARVICNDEFWFRKAQRDFGITITQWNNPPITGLKAADRYLFYSTWTKDGVVRGSEKFKSPQILLKRASAKGDKELADYFIDIHRQDQIIGKSVFDKKLKSVSFINAAYPAASNRHTALTYYLLYLVRLYKDDDKIHEPRIAAILGDRTLFDQMTKIYPTLPPDMHIFMGQSGNLPFILSFEPENGFDNDQIDDILKGAAEVGSNEVIDWAIQHGATDFGGAMWHSALGDRLDLVKFFDKHAGTLNNEYIYDLLNHVIEMGERERSYRENMSYLLERYHQVVNNNLEDLFSSATRGGSWFTILYLLDPPQTSKIMKFVPSKEFIQELLNKYDRETHKDVFMFLQQLANKL